MAVVDFLKQNHRVTVFYYNHGTDHSDRAENIVVSYSEQNGLDWCVRGGRREVGRPPKKVSQEEHWRNCRYKWMQNFDVPVVTAHHLDDCVETWIWSSLHGHGKIIPYRNQNVIRPFRLSRKRDLEMWCDLRGVPYVTDHSNNNLRFARNYIRHELMPHALKINPGLTKIVRKKILKQFDQQALIS